MGYDNMGPNIRVPPAPIDVTSEPPAKEPDPSDDLGVSVMQVPPAPTAMIECLPAENMSGITAISPVDDFPGIMGGEVSQTIIGPQFNADGDPLLLTEGLPTNQEAITQGLGNTCNTEVGLDLVTQTTLVGG